LYSLSFSSFGSVVSNPPHQQDTKNKKQPSGCFFLYTKVSYLLDSLIPQYPY
jgi:tRNA1(Val) A37 N6-methylase TrmN6